MDPRTRRLQADYEAVRRLVRLHPRVRIEGVAGMPPQRYRLELLVRSLRKQGDQIVEADRHRVEVLLPATYPRDAPYCRMLTPVFHPNIDPQVICIGDHWTAAERLDHMIQRIGEMLAFQSYNTKSPRNGEAACWVEEHVDQLPIDRAPFFMDLDAEPDQGGAAEGGPSASRIACGNCGAAVGPDAARCDAGHALCADCLVTCPRCRRVLCLACGAPVCPACGA